MEIGNGKVEGEERVGQLYVRKYGFERFRRKEKEENCARKVSWEDGNGREIGAKER